MWWLTLLVAWFLVIPILVCLVLVFFGIRYMWHGAQRTSIMAQVVEVPPCHETTCGVIVRYEYNHQSYQRSISVQRTVRVGQTVGITVDPQSPGDAKEVEYSFVYYGALMTGLGLLGTGVMGGLLFYVYQWKTS